MFFIVKKIKFILALIFLLQSSFSFSMQEFLPVERGATLKIGSLVMVVGGMLAHSLRRALRPYYKPYYRISDRIIHQEEATDLLRILATDPRDPSITQEDRQKLTHFSEWCGDLDQKNSDVIIATHLIDDYRANMHKVVNRNTQETILMQAIKGKKMKLLSFLLDKDPAALFNKYTVYFLEKTKNYLTQEVRYDRNPKKMLLADYVYWIEELTTDEKRTLAHLIGSKTGAARIKRGY